MKALSLLLVMVLGSMAHAQDSCELTLAIDSEPVADLINAVTQKKPLSRILISASKLNDQERIKSAEILLKRSLSAEQQKAIIDAHKIAKNKGYFKYSATDLLSKAATLQKAGFDKKDRSILLRYGISGGFEISQEINLSRYNIKARLTDKHQQVAFAEMVLQATESARTSDMWDDISYSINAYNTLFKSGVNPFLAARMVRSVLFEDIELKNPTDQQILVELQNRFHNQQLNQLQLETVKHLIVNRTQFERFSKNTIRDYLDIFEIDSVIFDFINSKK
jgi:hypothetical protein